MHDVAYIVVSGFGSKEDIFCPGIWKAQQRNKGSELTALSSEIDGINTIAEVQRFQRLWLNSNLYTLISSQN